MDSVAENERQYGYGGYVECCEGVVDPIFLFSIIAALAGLTYWLRLQVVTYISGRRSFNTDDSGLFLLLTNLSKMNEVVSDTEENSLLCYTGLASCLSTASLVALKDETVEETDILRL